MTDLCEDLSPVDITENRNITETCDVMTIHIFEDEIIAELQDIKAIQGQKAFCKHELNTLLKSQYMTILSNMKIYCINESKMVTNHLKPK